MSWLEQSWHRRWLLCCTRPGAGCMAGHLLLGTPQQQTPGELQLLSRRARTSASCLSSASGRPWMTSRAAVQVWPKLCTSASHRRGSSSACRGPASSCARLSAWPCCGRPEHQDHLRAGPGCRGLRRLWQEARLVAAPQAWPSCGLATVGPSLPRRDVRPVAAGHSCSATTRTCQDRVTATGRSVTESRSSARREQVGSADREHDASGAACGPPGRTGSPASRFLTQLRSTGARCVPTR